MKKRVSFEPLEESIPASVLKAEVRIWAERVGVTPREVHIRQMKRKWASCSSRGRLTFDVDLLKQPAALRARTIVHELLHLKLPNHGRLFDALLKTHLAPHLLCRPNRPPSTAPEAPEAAPQRERPGSGK